MTAVGELSNQLDFWAVLAACLNVGQEGRVKMLGFSLQTEEAQSDTVGGVSAIFREQPNTGQAFPS